MNVGESHKISLRRNNTICYVYELVKSRAGTKPRRGVVMGDTCVAEHGMAVIVGRDRGIMFAVARMVSMSRANSTRVI